MQDMRIENCVSGESQYASVQGQSLTEALFARVTIRRAHRIRYCYEQCTVATQDGFRYMDSNTHISRVNKQYIKHLVT